MSDRSSGDTVAAAGIGVLVLVWVAFWSGAQSAAVIAGCHRPFAISGPEASIAVFRLLAHPGNPGRAWGGAGGCLPGAFAYWLVTAFTFLLGATVPAILVYLGTVLGLVQGGNGGLFAGRGAGVERRRRLGVDPEGRFARGLDLLPLWVARPVPGRIVLGWVGKRRPAPRETPPADTRLVRQYVHELLSPLRQDISPRARLGEILRRAGSLLRASSQSALARSAAMARAVAAAAGAGRLVATENPRQAMDPAIPRILRPVAERRQGQRGSVIVLGPSQCGKTAALAIPAILEWAGPVIALSVKNDLLGATIARRRRIGQVRVFDPADVTGHATGPVLGTWSPVRQATTLAGARRAARSIANATAWTHQAGELGFWTDAGEDLLACLLWVAAHSGLGIDAPVRWVLTMDQKSVRTLLLPLAGHTLESIAQDGRQVLEAFDGVWRSDPKQISSIYLTARQMIRPWQEPTVQASATDPTSSVDWSEPDPIDVVSSEGRAGSGIDLEWLLADSPPENPATQRNAEAGGTAGPTRSGGAASAGGSGNTVYLCADLDEAERLAPVLGGLLDDLLRQAYAQAGRLGPLDPPLLIVIDEAGNWPLRSLPARISTCAGLGIQLMLIYQSKAQIDAAYERKADIVLANAVTKVAFAGLSDESSLKYASYLLGDEHVTSTSTSSEVGWFGFTGARPDSRSTQPTRLDLLPGSLLRQVRPGQALLIHNTLRPAHLHGRYWYLEPDLYALATGERHTRRELARMARRPPPRRSGEPTSLSGVEAATGTASAPVPVASARDHSQALKGHRQHAAAHPHGREASAEPTEPAELTDPAGPGDGPGRGDHLPAGRVAARGPSGSGRPGDAAVAAAYQRVIAPRLTRPAAPEPEPAPTSGDEPVDDAPALFPRRWAAAPTGQPDDRPAAGAAPGSGWRRRPARGRS